MLVFVSYRYKTLQKMSHQSTADQSQLSFLLPTFRQMLNMGHPLIKMTEIIDWQQVEKDFECYYKNFGRPSKPIRLMVGMLILKHLRNLSDEQLTEQWTENPYFQYFCGESEFQLGCPIEANEMSIFRSRIGKDGAEKIFHLSIKLNGDDSKEKEVIFDTTVQEKDITFPTDDKLYIKIIDKCRSIAGKNHLELRQSYKFVVRRLRQHLKFRSHPKRSKQASKASRKLKTIAGRLVRELERKLPPVTMTNINLELGLFKRVLSQKPKDSQKIYSLHEPGVQCISKGKAHKKYEFGCKTSIGWTKTTGVIVGAMSFERNPYDGNTLPIALEQVERLTGQRPKVAIADMGYRGRRQIGATEVVTPYTNKPKNNYQKRKAKERFRRRAGIEPIISHLKSDHRMARNFLKGTQGDHINGMMAAAAFNFKRFLRKLMDRIVFWLNELCVTLRPTTQWKLNPLF